MAARSVLSSETSSTRSSYPAQEISNRHRLQRPGKGHVIFTGPDGNSDYITRTLSPDYIGYADQSREHTGNLSYMWRGARSTPFPRSRRYTTGEIGWHAVGNMDRRLLQSRHQITLGEFRSQCEDRYTHRYLTPWYPQRPRPKSHPPIRFMRDDNLDDLRQVPIRKGSSATSTSTSSIKAIHKIEMKARSPSIGSSSTSSCR